MFLDNSLAFQPSTPTWATGQQVTADAAGTHIVDLAGVGVGVAPTMIDGYPQDNTEVGFDIGAGDGVVIPYLYLTVSAKGTNTGSITIRLDAAPDNGSYSEGSYTTVFSTADITANSLVVGDVLIVPVPPTHFLFPSETRPRFYRIYYDITGTVDLTFKAGLCLNPPTTLLAPHFSNNFLAV